MIDTHCHVLSEYYDDIDKVINFKAYLKSESNNKYKLDCKNFLTEHFIIECNSQKNTIFETHEHYSFYYKRNNAVKYTFNGKNIFEDNKKISLVFKPNVLKDQLIYKDDGLFRPGQVTDDSEMAMSQAYGILDNYDYRNLNPNLIFYYYVLWSKSHPSDIGTTTRNALLNLDLNKVNITDENIFSEKIKNKISIKNSGSLANGYLMRVSPLLTWFYMVNKNYVKEIIQTKSSNKYFVLYKKIHNEMAKDTQLTHPNKETAIAGSIMIFMGLCSIQQKYTGKEILEMTNILLENDFFEEDEIGKTLKNIFQSNLNEFSKPDFSKDDFFSDLEIQMGFYRHAFNLTIYYLSVFDEQRKEMSLKDIYTNMMFDISDYGGDTDTNGAIVGMVMGPLIGMENFDKKYFDVFLSFYSRERILYTNVYMYFYASYLKKIENKGLIIDRDASQVNFYFMQMVLEMLNNEIKI